MSLFAGIHRGDNVRFDLCTKHVRFARRICEGPAWSARCQHVAGFGLGEFPRHAHHGTRVRVWGQQTEDGMSFTSWGDALCFCDIMPDTGGDVQVFIPLLDPMCFGGSSREVPFIVGIELYQVQCLMGEIECPKRLMSNVDHDDVYEIRFVLDGQGVMRHDGLVQRIETGDAIVCKHGTVEFYAGMDEGEPPDARGMLWSLATFVVYIPIALMDMNTAEPREFYDFVLKNMSEFARERLWGLDRWHRVKLSQLLSGEESSDVLMSLLGGLKSVELSPHMIPQRVFMSYDENMDVSDSVVDAFPTVKRTLTDASTYMLPNQTNRLALLFDPFANTPIPFVFGVEIFEPGHRTKPHVHEQAYEVFFILSGEGEGFCGDKRFSVAPGDIVAFHPGNIHGIDNGPNERMYCIEIMIPDENFAEFVRSGSAKSLEQDDLCILIRVGCGG